MATTLAICRLELYFLLKRSSFWIYFMCLAIFTCLVVFLFGGVFPGAEFSGDTFEINAPFFVDLVLSSCTLISTFIVASFSAQSALRDFQHGFNELSFTLPYTPAQYIMGKLGGALLTNLVLYMAPVLAYAVACHIHVINHEIILPFALSTYWNVYYQKILINTFLLTTLFFTVSLFTRSTIVNWVAIIVFYILYFTSSYFFNKIATRKIGALLDPFGLISTLSIQVGQSFDQKNTTPVNLTGLYFWNRIIWFGTALIILFISLWKFSFFTSVRTPKKYSSKISSVPHYNFTDVKKINYSFTIDFHIKNFFHQLYFNFRFIAKSFYFYFLLAVILAFAFISNHLSGTIFETTPYPTTAILTEQIAGASNLFIVLLIMVLSGEIIWRDVQYRMHSILCTYPASLLITYLSKTVILLVTIIITLCLLILSGMIIQASSGYYLHEPMVYLKYFFGYKSIYFLVLCIAAIGFQSIAGNKFRGYLLFSAMFLYGKYFGYQIFHLGLCTPFFMPEVNYSSITGFQGSFFPFLMFAGYWLALALILWLAGYYFFYNREKLEKKDAEVLQQGFLRRFKIILSLLALLIIIIGSFIYYNTRTLNYIPTEKELMKQAADYEKKYQHLKKHPMLTLTAVKGNIDLFPQQHRLSSSFTITLKNESSQPISECLFDLNEESQFSTWKASVNWTSLFSDNEHHFYGYKLESAVLPGDSIQVNYEVAYHPKGFSDEGMAGNIFTNGTFLDNNLFIPAIGYNERKEITSNKIRQKYKLTKKAYAYKQDDSVAMRSNFLGANAHRINLSLNISTDNDQVAIAPGTLIETYHENGRITYAYRSEQPILNFFSIQSGRYKEYADTTITANGKPVRLSIYYHPSHNYNIKLMMEAMKDAIHYYTRAFGPYPYNQLRIVEFPYGSFAQSFAGTIPFSENIGFLADLRTLAEKNGKAQPVDYVYYVTAHEVAHQWWAHQITPAHTEGAQLLSEGLSQYSALMLMLHKYGREKVGQFLQMESFQYLQLRNKEQKEERPLASVLDNQPYIFYRKAGPQLMSLENYLGEEKINKALNQFLDKYKYRDNPYPVARNLVKEIDDQTPDSLKYLVNDVFDHTILYNNKIKTASYSFNDSLINYQIDIELEGHKLEYSRNGKEKEVTMNDFIELGIYNAKEELVTIKKVRVKNGWNRIHFSMDRKPFKVVLNPLYDLIEKEYNQENRVQKFNMLQ